MLVPGLLAARCIAWWLALPNEKPQPGGSRSGASALRRLIMGEEQAVLTLAPFTCAELACLHIQNTRRQAGARSRAQLVIKGDICIIHDQLRQQFRPGSGSRHLRARAAFLFWPTHALQMRKPCFAFSGETGFSGCVILWGRKMTRTVLAMAACLKLMKHAASHQVAGHRFSKANQTPFLGRKVRRLIGSGRFEATAFTLKWRTRLARTSMASCCANPAPMQMRGPLPNGK